MHQKLIEAREKHFPFLQFACEGCGLWSCDEDTVFCWHCKKTDHRALRIFEARQGNIKPFYVVCYGVSRHYGGPEEGGWWWDSLRILDVRKVWTWQHGLKQARVLREENPTCSRGRFSVIGGEDTYIQCYESPEDFPTEIYCGPTYE